MPILTHPPLPESFARVLKELEQNSALRLAWAEPKQEPSDLPSFTGFRLIKKAVLHGI